MSVTVYYGWGRHPEHGEGMTPHVFETEAEAKAFRWGVEEAIGWDDWAWAMAPGYRYCGTCDDWFGHDWDQHADQHGDEED